MQGILCHLKIFNAFIENGFFYYSKNMQSELFYNKKRPTEGWPPTVITIRQTWQNQKQKCTTKE
jgi:hypothetical protein